MSWTIVPTRPSAARARSGRGRAAISFRLSGEVAASDPVGSETAGPGHHPVVGVPFGAQEPEHAGNRRQANRPVAHPLAAQPLLIELEALRQLVRNRLMETGREQATDMRVYHSNNG